MRDIIFSILHNLGTPGFLRRSRIKNREISVLMFHRISDEYDPLWPPMPVRSFRLLIRELSKKAHVIALEDIDEIGEYPDKPLVVLSFDDGYRDFLENALPVLTDFKLPAHHNICPDLIDQGACPWTQVLNRFLQYNIDSSIELPNGRKYRIGNRPKQEDFISITNEVNELDNNLKRPWIGSLARQIPASKITKLMNWDQIRECAKLGIHIGSHGMNHLNLSKIDDQDTLSAEIAGSKKRILEEVGREPLIFAFPKGSYNQSSMEAVRKNGYKAALLCGDMVSVLRENNRKKDFYIFPRINICRTNWREENLRLLGFHQKLKSCIRRTSYILPGD